MLAVGIRHNLHDDAFIMSGTSLTLLHMLCESYYRGAAD